MNQYLLSILVFLPLLVGLALLFIPADRSRLFKWLMIIITGIQLILSVLVYVQMPRGKNVPAGVYEEASFQWVEKQSWIQMELGNWGKLSIEYFLGVDGLSAAMVLLTGIVMFIGAVSSWTIQQNLKGYASLYLVMSSSIMGCFLALDFFLFYLFFEFMLLPMYFLIGIWGGERREYASIKFFIYTLLGSLFILVVMIGLYLSVIDPVKTAQEMELIEQASEANAQVILQVQEALAQGKIQNDQQVKTFNMLAMMDAGNYIPDSLLHKLSNFALGGFALRFWAFLALFIGFAIKLPMVPLHTWLPDAHVEAPTPVSVVLAGILLKIGGYGMIRIVFSIFPDGAVDFAWFIGLCGMISIIYGGLNALAMADLKKMIAYSSVSHMGFVLIGLASLTSVGVNGAIYQMLSHGILSAMLFLVVGVLYDRTHDRQIAHYRGLFKQMPHYSVLVMIAFFASLGLPGFSGFIGEIFTLTGGFGSKVLPRWIAGISVLGIIIGAAYFLWTMQKMFLGTLWVKGKEDWLRQMPDLNTREWFMLLTLAILTLVFGVFPNLIFDTSVASAAALVHWIFQG